MIIKSTFKPGFTMMELVVVVALFGVVFSIASATFLMISSIQRNSRIMLSTVTETNLLLNRLESSLFNEDIFLRVGGPSGTNCMADWLDITFFSNCVDLKSNPNLRLTHNSGQQIVLRESGIDSILHSNDLKIKEFKFKVRKLDVDDVLTNANKLPGLLTLQLVTYHTLDDASDDDNLVKVQLSKLVEIVKY